MKNNDFLCGVIEGYYGRPWSFNQRKNLFEYCLRFGLNSYVYAPKDDVKHRSRWRDLYSLEESKELEQLIHLSKQCGIHFVYALSPGVDLTYSSEKDLNALKRKLDQLIHFGCECWAILFDDIDYELSQEDQRRFNSFAHAQVYLANEIYQYLHKPNIFLFCPTEYCSQMAKPSIEKSVYLQTIGKNLHEDIRVFWTGPKIISRHLTISHLMLINNILQRRVIIWDNLNANDYDQRRLYLGPFSGRPTMLSSRLSGILMNPNCEFELNFIPFNTLGQWFRSIENHSNEDNIDDHSVIYQSDQALNQAILEWLPEFHKVKSPNDYQTISKIDSSPQAMSPKPVLSSLNVDEDSQDSITENSSQISSSSLSIVATKIHRMDCELNTDLTMDDIRLLVDLFYLPYENGIQAQQIFLDFHWLRFNYSSDEKLNIWRSRALTFHNHTKTINRLVQRLISIPNRSLLYDLYNYIADMNATISLCSRYLHWIDNEKRSKLFLSGEIDPSSKRGGLAGDFLNLLPLGNSSLMSSFEVNNQTNIYFIRTMNTNDQSAIYKLCGKTCYHEELDYLLDEYPQILADRIIGGYWLSSLNNFDLCYSVETDFDDDDDDQDFSAFVLTIIESEKYDKLIQIKWIEQLHQKYPNVDQNLFQFLQCPQWIYDQYPIRVQIFPDITKTIGQIYFIGKKLIKIITDNLRQRGIHGCHTFIEENNSFLHEYYLRLGFIDISHIDQNDHFILLAKQF